MTKQECNKSSLTPRTESVKVSLVERRFNARLIKVALGFTRTPVRATKDLGFVSK